MTFMWEKILHPVQVLIPINPFSNTCLVLALVHKVLYSEIICTQTHFGIFRGLNAWHLHCLRDIVADRVAEMMVIQHTTTHNPLRAETTVMQDCLAMDRA